MNAGGAGLTAMHFDKKRGSNKEGAMQKLVLAILCLQAILSRAQLSSNQFKLSFSSSGISSLKRAQDVYDTDYILSGRTLGDVVVRYRTAPNGVWQNLGSGTQVLLSPSGNAITYKVGRAIPTVATSSRPSSSTGPAGVRALNDQIEPKSSRDRDIPFFSWGQRRGTPEWVQYDFPTSQLVSSAEVYWAIGSFGRRKCDLPVSWRLQYKVGVDWVEVRTSDNYAILPDQFNHLNFEPVSTQALRLTVQLPPDASSGIYEWRVNTREGKQVEQLPGIDTGGSFRLKADALVWTIEVRNRTAKPIEIGDLGVPLPLNTQYVPDKSETYTKRVIRHSFVAGDGSYIFWMRSNAVGPYLLMVPDSRTHLEYFDQDEQRAYTAYIHSAARHAELIAKGGTWRLPVTNLILAAAGQPGDSVQYSFKFRWAQDYQDVRNVLYQEGSFDVNVLPGMTVASDLPTMFSLRTSNKILEIASEHPQETVVKLVGKPHKDTYVYSAKFSKLGENWIKVRYGNGRYLFLDFFLTEPLETLIKKRAHFLLTHEQWNDPKLWYNGLYSQWDMKHQVLRSPDDLDGLQSYAVACDDPALGKAPYLAAKNIYFPDQQEITSIENYIQHYVWGGLQQKDDEPFPYSLYGIPNWKVNRESRYDDQRGKKHVWRIYDYPHVILLYYNMYLIARNYPRIVHYLDQTGYLERAYLTAVAFFTVPMEIAKWSAYETGTYNELVIPELIQALQENGKTNFADKLRAHWEAKAEFFINQHPDLFASEYPFDSTGFESTHALAKYAIGRLQDPGAEEFRKRVGLTDAQEFLEEQMRLNLACRGMEPAYYWLGSDYRASGNTSYTLSYMAQMGGWAVEDYALNFARDPIPYLHLGYASYLSSWALLNSGTPESNYGYWFPGKENDGGAGGGFEPRPWGRAWLGNKEMGRGSWWYSGEIDLGFTAALRTAATVVSDDPIFGWYAYGGDLERKGRLLEVVPKDGLRDRFDIVAGGKRFHLEVDRDGFAREQPIVFSDSLGQIKFSLENRSNDAHGTRVTVQGLPPGSYEVALNNVKLSMILSKHGERSNVRLPITADNRAIVVIRKN